MKSRRESIELSTLSRLSHAQLKQILSLNSPEEEIEDLSVKELIDTQTLPAHITNYRKKTNRLARPIQNTIELVGGLIETWWVIVSIVSLTLIFTIGAAIFIGLAGILYAGYTYYEQKKTEQRLIQSYQFSLLKLEASELLYGKIIQDNPRHLPHYDVPKTKVIGIGLLMSVTVFFSYFYGLSSIIQSLGYFATASAMVGPIGIAIAAVTAISLGVYFGFKYYEDKKYKHFIKSEQKILESHVNSMANKLNHSSKIMVDRLGVKVISTEPLTFSADEITHKKQNMFYRNREESVYPNNFGP